MVVLAHRGGAGPWRENTLEAFSGALRAGADGVELDVRRSADGELVVHHDAEVPGAGLDPRTPARRAPGVGPHPRSRPWRRAPGPSSTSRSRTSPTEPGYDPDDRVSADGRRGPGRGGARTGRPWPAHVVVSSFWPDTLAAVRASRGAGRARGCSCTPRSTPSAALDTAVGARVRGAAPAPLAGGRRAGRARPTAVGLAVATWTVNSPDELDAVVDAGVDVVITDSVADTLAHLGRR